MLYNMDELWKHYAKWNMPDTKGQMLYDLLYKLSGIGKFIEQKVE